jgi:cytochrome c-type protein NapC
MQASKGSPAICSAGDTREKFNDNRLELALQNGRGSRPAARWNAAAAIAPSRWTSPKQSPRASVAHQRFLFNGEKTCIDCHKGIAHHLPDFVRGIPGWQ